MRSFISKKKSKPKTSAALDFALGTMYYQLGRLTRSEQTYEKALGKFPSFLRARKNLGFVQLSLGKLDAACPKSSQSNKSWEKRMVSAMLPWAIAILSLGRVVSAENAYRMGILLHPQSLDARNGLVNCLLTTNRFAGGSRPSWMNCSNPSPTTYFATRPVLRPSRDLAGMTDAVVALETLKSDEPARYCGNSFPW